MLVILEADIKIQKDVVGKIMVFYKEETPVLDEGPFLKEERKLIDTIAERLGLHLLHQQLKTVFEEQRSGDTENKSEWITILDMLQQTNPKFLIRLSRKMVNYLCWTGIKEAEPLLERFSPELNKGEETIDENKPFKSRSDSDQISLCYSIFELAENFLSVEKILESIQRWTKEDRSGFLSKVRLNISTTC